MHVLMEISAYGSWKNQLILRMAAARVEPVNLNRIDTFSTFVRPENLTLVDWRADEFLQSIRATVMDAMPLEHAFTDLVHWLSDDDVIFCWDDRTNNTFQTLCQMFGFQGREIHRIRDGVLSRLNDKHRKKGNPIKLCSVRGYGISGSCYDAEKVVDAEIILAQNVGDGLERLSQVVLKNEAPPPEKKVLEDSSMPLVYSKTSHRKTIHCIGCGRMLRVTAEKKAFFPDMRSARQAGYHPCSCCSPVRKFYRKDETKLMNYSRPHGISISYHDDAVHVQSRFDFWRIIYDDGNKTLILLHRNTRASDPKGLNSPVPGYHVQKCEATSMRGILRSIADHDTYRENQDKRENEKAKKLNSKEARKVKKKQRKRKIRRTLFLIDALKASGQLQEK